MKKNISVISMDSVLQEWLLQKLIKEPPESDSAKELLSGIYDMVSGEINSLIANSKPLFSTSPIFFRPEEKPEDPGTFTFNNRSRVFL